jgi:putative phosphoesterase
MELGVVSDTHDNLDAATAAVEAFEARDIDTVLHCGDFIAPPLVSAAFGDSDLALHGVLGNNDGELDGLERTIDGLGGESHLHGRYATLEFDGLTVRMLHGDQGMDTVESEAQSGEYDVVCYGHFHVAEHREVEGTQVVNPGAHFPTVPEENRSVAVIDTDDASVEFVSL